MTVWKLLFAGVVIAAGIGVAVGNRSRIPSGREANKGEKGRPGYLGPSSLPNAVALLPAPPPAGSVEMTRDEDARNAALRLRGTPRYALAAADAVRGQRETAESFECAFGSVINAERAPVLYRLLFRVRFDVRSASYPAKSHFKRPRPFAVHNARSCYPPDEQMFRNDGSYPSARGAVGWAYAEVLAQVRPERAQAILERGAEFDRSRVICDLEWLSDVDAGRKVASATVARLEANSAFNADMAAARKEAAGSSFPVDRLPKCVTERTALAGGRHPAAAAAAAELAR